MPGRVGVKSERNWAAIRWSLLPANGGTPRARGQLSALVHDVAGPGRQVQAAMPLFTTPSAELFVVADEICAGDGEFALVGATVPAIREELEVAAIVSHFHP
jgi:hypothetical protein